MTDKYFEDFNKSVVVMANPRTVLNSKFAKKEVKEQVIRADQLVNYIRNTYQNSNEVEESDSKLLAIYNNNQLKDLISKMPTNIEELQEISDFGEIKVNKYGEDILRIVGKFKAR